MKLKPGVKLPTKTLFSDWPDPPSVVQEKRESPSDVESKRGKRKRRGSLFCARNNWGGRSSR